jgi:hypothetical protein
MSYLVAVVLQFAAEHQFIVTWILIGVLGCWYTSTSGSDSGGNS